MTAFTVGFLALEVSCLWKKLLAAYISSTSLLIINTTSTFLAVSSIENGRSVNRDSGCSLPFGGLHDRRHLAVK